jgi:hypothetical protein
MFKWIICLLYLGIGVKTTDTNIYDAMLVIVFLISKVAIFFVCCLSEFYKR